jgi:hypothetical protein
MTSSQSTRSPFARLVLFTICLAIAGSAVAGAHYYAVDLPQQKAPDAPDNGLKPFSKCEICQSNCLGKVDIYDCMNECDLAC